jgi:hypothetical protein
MKETVGDGHEADLSTLHIEHLRARDGSGRLLVLLRAQRRMGSGERERGNQESEGQLLHMAFRVRRVGRRIVTSRTRIPNTAPLVTWNTEIYPLIIDLTFDKIPVVMQPPIPTLPPKERLILDLLIARGPLFGLQLVALSEGMLKRGTVYVTLGRMETKGFVRSEQEAMPPGAIGLPRRLYYPTPLGERVLRAWNQMARELLPEMQI